MCHLDQVVRLEEQVLWNPVRLRSLQKQPETSWTSLDWTSLKFYQCSVTYVLMFHVIGVHLFSSGGFAGVLLKKSGILLLEKNWQIPCLLPVFCCSCAQTWCCFSWQAKFLSAVLTRRCHLKAAAGWWTFTKFSLQLFLFIWDHLQSKTPDWSRNGSSSVSSAFFSSCFFLFSAESPPPASSTSTGGSVTDNSQAFITFSRSWKSSKILFPKFNPVKPEPCLWK